MKKSYLLVLLLMYVSNVWSQRISLSIDQQSLEQCIKEIERQTSYRFIYTSEAIRACYPVTVKIIDERLEKVLSVCLEGQPLDYLIEDKHVILTKKDRNPTQAAGAILRGRVVDEDNTPVAGASVMIRHSAYVTVTDTAGWFYFSQVPLNCVLLITRAEMEPKEIMVYQRTVPVVHLKKITGVLDETFVIAYGRSTRRYATGTVTSIKKSELQQQAGSNPLAILAGRVSGLQVTQLSGSPGAPMTIRLRGQNSLANGNDPLIIVDGIPFPFQSLNKAVGDGAAASPLAAIDPQDIESIEVLKDADATAIYGSRGANGVILITTRRIGGEGMKIDLSSYTGTGKVTRTMELMNTTQYLLMRREALTNDGAVPTVLNAPDLMSWDTTRQTDWQKRLIGNVMTIADARLEIGFGKSAHRLFFSLGYHDESTVLPGRQFGQQRWSGAFRTVHKSDNKRFQYNFVSSYSQNRRVLPQTELASLIILPPNAPGLYDTSGKINWSGSTWVNPLSLLMKTHTAVTTNSNTSINLSYAIGKRMEAKLFVGYARVGVQEHTVTPYRSFDPQSMATASAGFGKNNIRTFMLEPQLTCSLGKGAVNADILAGTTIQASRSLAVFREGTGYASDRGLHSLEAANAIATHSNADIHYRYVGYFIRAKVDIRKTYQLSVTGRRDGSGWYGQGNRFAGFGSLGFAWIFSKEKCMTKNDLISYGKMKFSVGSTGNDQINDHHYMIIPGTMIFPYQNTTVNKPSFIYNTDYTWERGRRWEAGIDLGFRAERLLISARYYHNSTHNQLLQFALPPSTGYFAMLKNLPALIRNNGWELECTSTNIKTSSIDWTTSFNITFPRTKLLRFDDLATTAYANKYIVGQTLFISKRYQSLGVNTNNGNYQFTDMNGDGRINLHFDQQSVLFTGLSFFGGLQNQLTIRKFSFSLLIQFVKQSHAAGFQSRFGRPGTMSNQPVFVLSRWQQAGDKAIFQQFSQANDASATAFHHHRNSDASASDASFIRGKSLSLSYDISPGMKTLKNSRRSLLFLQAQNFFTITRYDGLDPETKMAMPAMKTITAGIRVEL